MILGAAVAAAGLFASRDAAAQTVSTLEIRPGGNAYSFHGQSIGRIKTFSADSEARAVVERIMASLGLPLRFKVRAGRVPNASAILMKNGERLIVYNTIFMEQVKRRTGRYWAQISIMAHEIGHHLSFHMSSNVYDHDAELEADFFSGFALAKLGASMDDALAAMRSIASETASKTHPARADRLQAIAAGYRNAAAGRVPDPRRAPSAGQPRQDPTQTARNDTRVPTRPKPRPRISHAPSPKSEAAACKKRSGIAYCASSYLPTGGVNRSNYGPGSLADGNNRSAWVEGLDGTGIGEWLLIDWGRERLVRGIRLRNGYSKSRRHWRINGRVTSFEIRLSNGKRVRARIRDVSQEQMIVIHPPQPARWLRAEITGAKRGSKYADTAINEIRAIFD